MRKVLVRVAFSLVLVPSVAAAALALRHTSSPAIPRIDEGLDAGAHVRLPVVEPVADSIRGLGQGWMDFGYSWHTLQAGRPIDVDFSNYGGLILGHTGPVPRYGGLSFRYRAPEAFGVFLDVQLQTGRGLAISRILVDQKHATPLPDGFLDVWIPMAEMNPAGKTFERVMFFARNNMGRELVQIDNIGFTAAPPVAPRPATFAISCAAPGHPISPLIYGVAAEDDGVWDVGATARRWGGNPTTRYNWELSTDNRGRDWFFVNAGSDSPTPTYQRFLDANKQHGLRTALTVPTLGWVAKDATSFSFPVSVFGPQQAAAPDRPDAGNGVSPSGKELTPGQATRTSVTSSPESIRRWVDTIHRKDASGGRSVDAYILDNEPMLWNSTHRDVHPQPATYDELLEKTLSYAVAIRAADPFAVIAGPAEWGWQGYHYSAKDVAYGLPIRPDRRLHGDVPLIPWYLRKIREYEQKTGVRILDLLDVHFYPMAQGMGHGTRGETDSLTSALRIRSTRSLWDPTYVDESWINDRMRVLPLLRQWIAENRPGLGISIGEWNFGAETHMSGGLATAEVLGRFGTEGVTSAYYWTSPANRSPSFWAFRAFRNFDGAGGHFLDWSVPVRTNGALTSLFASRDTDRRHLVAVLLNQAEVSPLAARVTLEGCGEVTAARAFGYAGGEAGFEEMAFPASGASLAATVKPYSITVLDLTLTPPPN